MTRMPVPASIADIGCEMAPQISTCGPNAASRAAWAGGSVPGSPSSRRLTTRPSSMSATRTCRATSKTGEIRPFQVVSASLMQFVSHTIQYQEACQNLGGELNVAQPACSQMDTINKAGAPKPTSVAQARQ
jgi:hypothetical protein